MATYTHTPEGRDFDSSLIYFEVLSYNNVLIYKLNTRLPMQHKNDYWTQIGMQSACETYAPIVDLWDSG
jgi:hypothetical protein